MNNNNFTMFFITMSLINFSIGMSNMEKNNMQEQRQKEIENKINKILELLENGE